jgi:hypothetical protein
MDGDILQQQFGNKAAGFYDCYDRRKTKTLPGKGGFLYILI